MRAVKLIFILLCFVVAIYAQNQQKLVGVFRDQAPSAFNVDGWSAGEANGGKGFDNTDFQIEGYDNNEKGLCGAQCNRNNLGTCGKLGLFPDETPQYAYKGRSPGKNIRSPDSFYNWFHNTVQNRQENVEITLKYNNQNDVYFYGNDSFFPLDGKGWKDRATNKHNYAYCMEARTRFGYRGGEVFTFYGDDDVWVYINGYLVIDLGSLHTKLEGSVKLDDLTFLKTGNNYRLDFFYCERHTTESNFFLTTSLEVYCTYEDHCGICEGNGQSCCDTAACDDKDECTVDYCKVQTKGCDHAPRNCTAIDKCHIASCDSKVKGGCVQREITCTSSDPCVEKYCDPDRGCVERAKNCDDGKSCTTDKCEAGVGCTHTLISCDNADQCKVGVANNNTAGCCTFSNRVCNDNSKCTSDRCDSSVKGGCVYDDLCVDDDLCTNNVCNPSVGCSFPKKVCGNGDKCLNSTCNPRTGACTSANVVCTAKDRCSVPSCANDTGCLNTPLDCNDFNACTNDKCDAASRGCYYEARVCEDNDACTSNQCSNSTGCIFPKINIDDGDACTKDTCDPKAGVKHDRIPCDDGNACTRDSCDVKQGCVFTPISCDDNDPCTEDSCNKNAANNSVACRHDRLEGCTVCKDTNGVSLDCTSADRCFPSVCDTKNKQCSNTTVNCNDNNACTVDTCTNGDCKNTPRTDCVSTDLCLQGSCDAKSGCVFSNKTCNDFDPCTIDKCSSPSGTCTFTPVTGSCISCGNSSCSWTDPCKPKVCNPTTLTCEEVKYDCNDGDACTVDTCVTRSGRAFCDYSPFTCPSTGDVCNPNVCDSKRGCGVAPVTCDTKNPCLESTCHGNATTGAQCSFADKVCSSVDACFPQVCNATTGTCGVVPVVCNDNDPCTIDGCAVVGGAATCTFTPKDCGSDECGPKTCTASGECVQTTISCNDGNTCTDDFFYCNGTAPACNYTESLQCDDKNPCTTEVCDSSNSTSPCIFTPVKCAPRNLCETVLPDCDPVKGCVYSPITCPGATDVCKIATCDPRAGCIAEDKVCTVSDTGCFRPVCNSSAPEGEQCQQERRDGFGGRTSTNGVLCALRYDSGARAAAIGTGAAVGIAIGAAAAAGFIGYGGKKGYDYWKVMQNQRFDGVQNNPLYEAGSGAAENPLYRHSTTL